MLESLSLSDQARYERAYLTSGGMPVQRVHGLIERAIEGDISAWQALMLAWEPQLQAMARGHRSLRAKGLVSEDDLAEVVTQAFSRLRQRDFASLRRWLAVQQAHDGTLGQVPPRTIESWLYGALDFSVRAHLRARFGRAPRARAIEEGAAPPNKRDLGSLAGRLPTDEHAGPQATWGVTAQLTLASIRALVRSEFSPQDADAMHRYYEQGQSFAEIAQALQLPEPKAAERLIRRLNARLRYRLGR